MIVCNGGKLMDDLDDLNIYVIIHKWYGDDGRHRRERMKKKKKGVGRHDILSYVCPFDVS